MKVEQQERANRLSELLDNLGFVMTDPWVMESPNAVAIFRKLLTVQRGLERDLNVLPGIHERFPVPEDMVPANYSLHGQTRRAP